MSEIIDIQAPPEKVVNAMNQMTAAAQRFGGAVDGLAKKEFHDPWLKGDRAVKRASASMVTGLIQATSVSDALANSLLQVEKGGRLGLGLAVGVAIGVAAYEALSKAIEKSKEVHQAAEKQLSRPLGIVAGLSAAGINAEFNSTAAALAAEQKQDTSFSEAVLGTFSDPKAFLKDRFGLFGDHQTRGDQNFDRQIALNERLNELAQAKGEAELRIVQFKKDALDGDEHAVAYAKAELEYKNKTSELKLAAKDNPALAAGFTDSMKAAQMELEVQKQIADKKQEKADVSDLVKEEDDRAASEIANFQGSKEEKEDFATARNKERLQNEIDILHAYKDQEGEKKKQLDLDELTAKAAEKKAEDQKKADKEAFKDAEDLAKAKSGVKSQALEMEGRNFQASILKQREATEQKIAAYLKDQKGQLAGQAAIAGKLGIIKTLGDRLGESPAESAARASKEAEERRRTALAEAQLRDAADREKRGAKLDENNPVTQALRAQQEIDKQLAQGKDQGKGDFSSVASLAGLDFSSLAAVGKADFSSLMRLTQVNVI